MVKQMVSASQWVGFGFAIFQQGSFVFALCSQSTMVSMKVPIVPEIPMWIMGVIAHPSLKENYYNIKLADSEQV